MFFGICVFHFSGLRCSWFIISCCLGESIKQVSPARERGFSFLLSKHLSLPPFFILWGYASFNLTWSLNVSAGWSELWTNNKITLWSEMMMKMMFGCFLYFLCLFGHGGFLSAHAWKPPLLQPILRNKRNPTLFMPVVEEWLTIQFLRSWMRHKYLLSLTFATKIIFVYCLYSEELQKELFWYLQYKSTVIIQNIAF